jgi:hypothetical protein
MVATERYKLAQALATLARCLVPNLVLNGLDSCFWVWGQFCGVHLFLALSHGVTFQKGWM